MRRQLIVAALTITLPLFAPTPLLGQTAEEVAARQEAEDNYRRISARVDDLFAAVESMQKRFSALQDELHKLSEQVGRANDRTKDAGTQEMLNQLARAIEKVDQERRSDRDKMLAAFADLEKSIAALGKSDRSASKARPRVQAPKDDIKPAPEKGYEYEVRAGDTLTGIVAALNKQGIKLTAKQIADANPSVNWNRLQIGHKLFIPEP